MAVLAGAIASHLPQESEGELLYVLLQFVPQLM
jgi:hypothetical protein